MKINSTDAIVTISSGQLVDLYRILPVAVESLSARADLTAQQREQLETLAKLEAAVRAHFQAPRT